MGEISTVMFAPHRLLVSIPTSSLRVRVSIWCLRSSGQSGKACRLLSRVKPPLRRGLRLQWSPAMTCRCTGNKDTCTQWDMGGRDTQGCAGHLVYAGWDSEGSLVCNECREPASKFLCSILQILASHTYLAICV